MLFLFQLFTSAVKWFFAIVIGLDVFLLALPTRWMGPLVEFWCAVTLAFATAVLWLRLKVSREE